MVLVVAIAALWASSAPGGLTDESHEAVLAPGSFLDDGGSVHELNVEALAAAGITQGCNPPDNTNYCPAAVTTRAQMATLLARALDLPPTDADYFNDDAGLVHEADINALAAAGITQGCNPPDNTNYCPATATTRAQMATFLVRALDLDVPEMWSLVHDARRDPIPGSSYAWHLAYGDLGYVAAGPVLAVHQDAAVWTSPDGRDWTYIPNTDYLFGGGAPGNQASVQDVAVGNGAMVAVGAWFDPDSTNDSDATVWRSTDLTTWERIPDDETVFGDPGTDHQRMKAVTFHPTIGFVAVGSDSELAEDPDEMPESVAAVWTSPNGLEWARAADENGALEGERAQSMEKVVAGTDRLVAIGSDHSTNTPAFWVSTDGENWARAATPPDAPTETGLGIRDVIVGPTGFVVIADEIANEVPTPTAYTSPDGYSWTRNETNIAALFWGVTHDGSEYIAVGQDLDSAGSLSGVWGSSDAVTWYQIGERSGAVSSRWLNAVLATPAGLIVGGGQSIEGPYDGSLWLRP